MPAAEKAAAALLKRMGYDVVQQYPVRTGRKLFFADIAIPSLRMVLEIDGGYHSTCKQKRLDRNRSACIRRMGWHVCRLTNRDARSMEAVRAKIDSVLKKRAGK